MPESSGRAGGRLHENTHAHKSSETSLPVRIAIMGEARRRLGYALSRVTTA